MPVPVDYELCVFVDSIYTRGLPVHNGSDACLWVCCIAARCFLKRLQNPTCTSLGAELAASSGCGKGRRSISILTLHANTGRSSVFKVLLSEKMSLHLVNMI